MNPSHPIQEPRRTVSSLFGIVSLQGFFFFKTRRDYFSLGFDGLVCCGGEGMVAGGA